MGRMKSIILILNCLFLLIISTMVNAARIKDVTSISGIRDNQLVGYGLVVGLDGTGDKVTQAPFTQQSFINMLLQFGIKLPANTNLQIGNVAAVAISATLPPFSKIGQKIDVTVSSIGNASSLRGGELLMAPLKGADGEVYAIAQGSVIVSGFGAQGGDGSKVIVNSTGSGRIPNGASIEQTIETPFVEDGNVYFELNEPDFTTANLVEVAINKEFGKNIAHAIDASEIIVKLDQLNLYRPNPALKDERSRFEKPTISLYVPVIARIQNIIIEPASARARVVVNARTGTIVVGKDVTIAPVAISHGNLTVVISEQPFVSQPQPLSNGATVVGTASNINVNQTQSHAFVFSPGPSLKDLVDAINLVGAAPGDLISILEVIKQAGALHAELEVI